jgi:hypothetical protein
MVELSGDGASARQSLDAYEDLLGYLGGFVEIFRADGYFKFAA